MPVEGEPERRYPLAGQCAAILLGVLAIASLSLSVYLAAKAGCTGDTKSGAYGDPAQALAIENWGFLSELVGIILFAIALIIILRLLPRLAVSPWEVVALATIVLAIGSYILLWNIEGWAVQRCF